MSEDFSKSARDRFVEQELIKLSPLYLVAEGLTITSVEPLADPIDCVKVKMSYDTLHHQLISLEQLQRQRHRPKSLTVKRRNFNTDPDVPPLGFIYVRDEAPLSLTDLLDFVNARLDCDIQVDDVDTSRVRINDPKVALYMRPESIFYAGRIIINVY